MTWASIPQECENGTNLDILYLNFHRSGQCTLGVAPFLGSQGSNAVDGSVIQTCLAAPGAPDPISGGYQCFSHADIAGNLVGAALVVPSLAQCIRNCEANSDLCSLAVYTNTQLCVLMANAFLGQFDNTGQSGTRTACLRSLTGG